MTGPRRSIQDAMAQALQRTHRLTTLNRRVELVRHVGSHNSFPLSVPEVPEERTHLHLIVDECARQDCLTDLVDAVEALHLGDEYAMLRLRQLNDEWDGSAQFSDPEQWWQIKDILKQIPLTNGFALFTAAQRDNPAPAHCRTVWHLFAHLAGSNSGEQGVPLFMIFLWMVADQIETRYARPLKHLLAQLATEWNITGPFLRLALERIRTVGSTARHATLLILIDPHETDALTYTVRHWYGWDADPGVLVHRGDAEAAESALPDRVREIVRTAESRFPLDDRRLRIEFVLPDHLLNLPVEQWAKEYDSAGDPVPLYLSYAVVVRSLERMRNRHRHAFWWQRWRTVADTPGFALSRHAQDHPHGLAESIAQDTRIVALVLSGPPEPVRSDGMKEIGMAVRAGIPIIVWHRRRAPTPQFREIVDNSIRFGEITELPDRAFRLRLAHWVDDDERADISRNLVVLWDDPIRVPEQFTRPPPDEG
ncbi:hypothetical protein [Actinoplanes sp. NBRC 101535]|uniref:VMAP-C domain-containing protein n=1 Tax=Actinoplanes sp. NBRC 101535 TaxID=3032196 RepID=UPI0025577743|nr:hypothetical protein [Actinoplanes sp. NBRC 101535]